MINLYENSDNVGMISRLQVLHEFYYELVYNIMLSYIVI